MSVTLKQFGEEFKIQRLDRKFGGTTADVLTVDGDGVLTAGDLSVDADGVVTIAGTAVLSGTVSDNLSMASGKDITFAGGASDLDMSLSSGILKGPTGLTTFAGKIAATAAAWTLADPGNAGAIAVTSSGVCMLTSAGAETRTLAIPTFVGQRLDLCMDTDGGDIVLTVAQIYDQSAHTTITFNDAGDHVELVGVKVGGAFRWRLVVNNGCTLG